MTTPHRTDPRSVAGKTLMLDARVQLLVIGAGPAGIAAAREGAARGLSVMLVDENPVAADTMGSEVPLQFGGRVGGAARNRGAMTEAMLATAPGLAEAFDEGVDVRLGTACWGLYVNGATMGWMPGPVAGLIADGETSQLVGFGQAVVATGRRDMGLAFPGWETPGVIGATAATRLATRYSALEGRRAVVLGSGTEALLAAAALLEVGIAIAAVLEQAPAPIGPRDLLEMLTAAGAELLCGEAITGVRAGPEGVTAALTRSGRSIAADLVVLGVGAVPMVDLLGAAGCRLPFDAARGGFVPPAAPGGATSLGPIRAAGDCAGIWPAKSRDPGIATAEGRAAAAAAAAALSGAPAADQACRAPEIEPPRPDADPGPYRAGWLRACVLDPAEAAEAAGTPCAHVCLCEEVTVRELLELRPPRYLGWTGGDNRRRSLAELLGAGPPDPDQVKRLTRAGMGACQGRRCREQVQGLLALQAGVPLAEVALAGYRAPVRPLPLSAARPQAADPAFDAHWDSWFGMPRQWVPYWDVEPEYTVAGLAVEKPDASE